MAPKPRKFRVITVRKVQKEDIRQAFSSPPIFDNIFVFLDPGDAIRLGKTCTHATKAFNSFSHRGFNIERLLRRFFNDPDGFRRMQAKTCTLISGSSALQFLDRTFYPNSDLDLYIPRQHAEEMGNWILSEGYTYKPTERAPDFLPSAQRLQDFGDEEDDYIKGTNYRTNGLVEVYEFTRGDSIVQLISARHSPFHAIISFHSTCVMNFITYEAAHSLYPAATFDGRIGVTNGEISEKENIALAKYGARGFNIVSDIQWHGAEDMRRVFYTGEGRWVKDKYSWRVPLRDLNPPIAPRILSGNSRPMKADPAVSNGWFLNDKTEFSITTGNFFVSKLLKYRYQYSDPTLGRIIMRFLKTQGTRQFERLEAEGVSAEDAPSNPAWNWWDGALDERWTSYYKRVAELQ